MVTPADSSAVCGLMDDPDSDGCDHKEDESHTLSE